MTESLTHLRQALHRNPDLSGEEGATADYLAACLAQYGPARIERGLGGHGLAVVFDSASDGPTVLLRAELDALPIQEQGAHAHRSVRDGVAHLCGHDGHMAVLVGIAQRLHRAPPLRGRVLLLFQPAEETGAGARAVLADPRFAALRPDWAFALHNMPGLPLGALAVAPGPASCASVGLALEFSGVEAHAAFPETGRSPAGALRGLLDWLAPLGVVPPMGPDFRLATLCHLSMGTPAFGIAPAHAKAMVTLRALSDDGLAALEGQAIAQAQAIAQDHGVGLAITRHDHFNATLNDPAAAGIVAHAAQSAGIARTDYPFPMRPSEDFGAFSAHTRTALFFMGAGQGCAPLHNPAYDFPDTLIDPAVRVFMQILQTIWAE
jgi:amidohydrolase